MSSLHSSNTTESTLLNEAEFEKKQEEMLQLNPILMKLNMYTIALSKTEND